MAVSWKVYWNEYVLSSYLYGSTITFHGKDDVEYLNELVPPGTVLQTWYSRTNYQMKRLEPSLPIIDGENNYHFSADISSENSDGYIFRFVFYDKFGEEAGSLIIRDDEADFKCPLKTYSYELQLISTGTTGFHFHHVTISEK